MAGGLELFRLSTESDGCDMALALSGETSNELDEAASGVEMLLHGFGPCRGDSHG